MKRAIPTALAAVLAAPAAFAATPMPESCITNGGQHWEITVTDGPCQVPCDDPTFVDEVGLGLNCSAGADCTAVEYTVVKRPAKKQFTRVATLIPEDAGFETVDGQPFASAPCAGEPQTLLGRYQCEDKAVRWERSAGVDQAEVHLVLHGFREVVPTSVVVRSVANPPTIESCLIQGLGGLAPFDLEKCVPTCGPAHPFQPRLHKETIRFKDCEVEFTYDLDTGEIVDAALTASSHPDCDFITNDVKDMEITYSDGEVTHTLGGGQYALGSFSSGNASCTTYFRAGRAFTVGRPCPR